MNGAYCAARNVSECNVRYNYLQRDRLFRSTVGPIPILGERFEQLRNVPDFVKFSASRIRFANLIPNARIVFRRWNGLESKRETGKLFLKIDLLHRKRKLLQTAQNIGAGFFTKIFIPFCRINICRTFSTENCRILSKIDTTFAIFALLLLIHAFFLRFS